MIADNTPVSLPSDERKPIMEVYVGAEILTFRSGKPKKGVVKGKRAALYVRDLLRLMLSTGESLALSKDQTLAIAGDKKLSFRPASEILVGDTLRGERAGMPITVRVIGKAVEDRPMRLVALDLGGDPYICAGVLCR